MKCINLIPQYKQLVLKNRDLNGYTKSYPALFRHYFRYWADRKLFHKTLTAEQTHRRVHFIMEELRAIKARLRHANPGAPFPSIALFVGQGTSNGHAFYDGARLVVWIPIETYETKTQMRVFLLHEILHGLHYAARPEFYFKNAREKRHIGRQIITEGIATYLTKYILKVDDATAIWADYLPKAKSSSWLKECEKQRQELFAYAFQCWNITSSKIELFFANDSSDILRYRAGYFIGLRLIETFVQRKHYTPKELLRTPRLVLEKTCRMTRINLARD